MRGWNRNSTAFTLRQDGARITCVQQRPQTVIVRMPRQKDRSFQVGASLIKLHLTWSCARLRLHFNVD